MTWKPATYKRSPVPVVALAVTLTASCSRWSAKAPATQKAPALTTSKAEPAGFGASRRAKAAQKAAETAPAKTLRPLKNSVAEIAKVLGLSSQERAMLEKQGLLVVRSSHDFGSVPSPIYDRIYQNDLPVLITSDSILYAFHRRYMEFLQDLESRQLSGMLSRIISTTRESLLRAHQRRELMPTQAREIDIYLTVAASLLDKPQAPTLASTPKSRVQQLLKLVKREKRGKLVIFGESDDLFDYTQFKPRGHYRKSPELRRYFRTVMWLSRVRLMILEYHHRKPRLRPQAFATAAALSWLLHESGSEKLFVTYQGVLDKFVGPGDDDSPLPIIEFLKKQGIIRASEIPKIPQSKVQSWLSEHAKERSRIASHQYFNVSGLPKEPIPRSFMMIGQRFTLDSEILGNLVYDRLVDPQAPKRPIVRMLPKSLDVIAALGNPQAKIHLKGEFSRYRGYERALDKIRDDLAKRPAKVWTKNVHSAWLGAIASLHANPDNPELPAVFRSHAWKDKTLQTQLASWAELRHDHILYVKQSVTGSIGCEFPDAYVEPVPEFFAKMKTLVGKLHEVIDNIEREGLSVEQTVHDELGHFSAVLDQLHTIAGKELKHEPLSPSEQQFLKQAVEMEAAGYGPVRWDGWYPKLLGERPTANYEPTIADVHTDPPGDHNGQVARVLHAGTGAFDLATVLVDCPGERRCAYVGPVSSFYELIPKQGKRLTDEEWYDMHRSGTTREARPSWIQSFRAPDRLTPQEREEEQRLKRLFESPDPDELDEAEEYED